VCPSLLAAIEHSPHHLQFATASPERGSRRRPPVPMPCVSTCYPRPPAGPETWIEQTAERRSTSWTVEATLLRMSAWIPSLAPPVDNPSTSHAAPELVRYSAFCQ
jgi:hypothetical protein